MKRFLGCGVVLVALFLAGNAFGDGNDLLTQCTNALNFTDGTPQEYTDATHGQVMYCFGMMEGILTMNKYYEAKLGKKALFCTPKSNMSNGRAARIVVKYLREHPAKLHQQDTLLAIEALMKAFPCK